MTTAVEVAERALKRILVQADDAPLDPSDYADFYDSMNSFMEALEGENVFLGYTPVSNPADEITIPKGAIRGLVANMAIEVASDYGVTTSAELQLQARNGMRVMRRLGRAKVSQSFPSNLPLGSGQEDFTRDTDPFYGISASAVLHLENTENLSTGFDDLVSPIRGFWSIASSVGLLADITGRVRNVTGKRLSLTVKATLTAIVAGADTFQVILTNSEASAATATATATATNEVITFAFNESVELEPEGSLFFQVANLTGTNTLRFYDSRLEVS